jgi:Protein of unknown function (DUF1403)
MAAAAATDRWRPCAAFAPHRRTLAELGRSSQKLIAVAPRLRARGAGAVIETLLNEDAVPAARRGAISARGSRRLFDRLVALGGVRELTGRSTFRLYGQ